jgi:trigger factor
MSVFNTASENEVSVKELSKKNCSLTLEITADKELVNKCFHNALLQVQSRAQLQGFRAGKAPLDMVKKNFPSHIAQRAADLVVRNASAKALDKTKLRAVMLPVVTKADFTAVKENAPFTFEVSVDVAPEIIPVNYTGIEVSKKSETVSQEEIKKHIDDILDHNSSLEAEGDKAVVTENNFVVVSYKGAKDGVSDKKYSSDGELVDMSAPQTIAGLADAIKGLKKNDVKEFETKLDDGSIKFTVTIDEIKKKVKPELNDDFAKDVGFDTVEKLKEKVKVSMEEEAKSVAEKDIVKQIEDALIKNNTFDIPQSLVEYHTNQAVENFIKKMFQGQKAELTEENKKTFSERMRPTVERDLKIGYIIHAIAEKENLNATEADWQNELNKALTANPNDEKRVKEFFNEKKHDILASLDEKKVFDFLKEKANIK